MKKIFDYIEDPNFEIAADATSTFKVIDLNFQIFLMFSMFIFSFANKSFAKKIIIIINLDDMFTHLILHTGAFD